MDNMVSPQTFPDGGLLYEAFSASAIGIALEDLEGRPLFVNPALCSMLGFSEQEMRSKHCVDFSPPEDAQKDWALFQQLQAGSIPHYQIEKRYYRRDGSLLWGRLSISLLKSRPTPMVVAIVENITEQRTAQDQERQALKKLQELGRRLLASQEEERARIGRELHDDINQRLAMLSVELQGLEQNPVELQERVQELRKRVAEISDDVQALSHELHSSKLEYLGVIAGIRNWCREFSEKQKVAVDFESSVATVLPFEVGLCLFRVAQEALHNSVKHSETKRIKMQVSESADEVQLTISDYGSGFDIKAAKEGRGLGLTSMEERVRLVNGSIDITSKPGGGGTTIRVRVPLPKQASARIA